MQQLTYMTLGMVYQVAWYAAAVLIWAAAMGSPAARWLIGYLTKAR